MTNAKPWDRRMWGVVHYHVGLRRHEPPMLLGAGWDKGRTRYHQGEPSRTLVFTSRKLAREWCAKESEWCGARTDCCRDWRFVPVKVRELVEVVGR